MRELTDTQSQILMETHPPNATQGAEVVLVVDDEEHVRAPISRMLRHLGHFVLEASNGENALHVMQDYHSPVHLVVSDVRMPEMDGIELVEMLRSWYPKIRVLMISGVAMNDSGAHLIEGSGFLAKPFTLDELAKAVRTLLEAEWEDDLEA